MPRDTAHAPPKRAHPRRRLLDDVVLYKNCSSDATGNVLVLHGLHEEAAQYTTTLAEFRAAELNTYAYDAINHGRSVKNEHEQSLVYSFDRFVLTAWAVIEHIVESNDFNGKPIVLFGHSMGALTIARLLQNHAFTHKYGHLIAGAVCASMIFRVDHNVPFYQRIALRPILKYLCRRKWGRDYMAAHTMGRSERMVEKMHEVARKQIGPAGKKIDAGDAEELGGYSRMIKEAEEAEKSGNKKDAADKRMVTWLTGHQINEAVYKANEHVERIRVPVIFPHGLNDIEAPLISIQEAIERMGHGLILYYAGRGHYLFQSGEDEKGQKALKGSECEDVIAWIKLRIERWEKGHIDIPRTQKEERPDAFRGQIWSVAEEVKLLGLIGLKKMRACLGRKSKSKESR